MSVINKMLRDLDDRRSANVAASGSPSSVRPGGMDGVASVRGASSAKSGFSARLWRVLPLTTFLLLGVAGAAWWYLVGSVVTPAQLRPLAALAVASAPVAAAPVTTPLPAVAAPVPGVNQSTEPASQPGSAQAGLGPALPREARVVPPVGSATSQARVSDAALAPSARSKVAGNAASSDASVKTEVATKLPAKATRKEPPREEFVAKPAPANTAENLSTSAESASLAQAFKPRAAAKPEAAKPPVYAPPPAMVNPALAASLEALAQAQNLWATGSRDSAIELMRKAVAVAERTINPAADPAALSVFVSLVRELARMELAQGQVTEAWDLLIRLEPLLRNQADLWAVRGNAAQRLGKHQDSANAYLMALKLRPGEPRWMLGAAVSLAVQGQTGAAAELADKARAAGVVSPEVSAYLRQLGVPLRDR